MLNHDILFSDSLDELLSQYTQNDDPALIIYCTSGKLQIELNGVTRSIPMFFSPLRSAARSEYELIV